MAVATIQRYGKTIEQTIAAVALTSTEQHNLKAGMKLTQGMAKIQPGITQERIDGIYRSLDEYVVVGWVDARKPNKTLELYIKIW